MSEQDDLKLSKLLKKSPVLTPPESFYRGVLEKVGSADRRVVAPSAPWYWGNLAKGLATACILMVVVLVARDKKRSEPEMFRLESDSAKIVAIQNESRPALKSKAVAFMPKSLSESPEVQSRLQKNISGYVKNPSPFEDIDEEENKKDVRREAAIYGKEGVVMQARDTTTGVASQLSFPQRPAAAAKKVSRVRAQDLPMPTLEDKMTLPSVSGGSGASVSFNAMLPKSSAKEFEITGPAASRNILQRTMPLYPSTAQDKSIAGTVRLYIKVSPEGHVDPNIRISKSTGYPDLDNAGIQAVQKWLFAPASEESWGVITLQFPPNN